MWKILAKFHDIGERLGWWCVFWIILFAVALLRPQIEASYEGVTDLWRQPTAMDQVRKLAAAYESQQPGGHHASVHHSAYETLTRKLSQGHWDTASDQLDKLLRTKTQAQIVKHFEALPKQPVTHHRPSGVDPRTAYAYEVYFIASLSATNKALYVHGVEEREGIEQALLRLIDARERATDY
jgi:hypothetical protein